MSAQVYNPAEVPAGSASSVPLPGESEPERTIRGGPPRPSLTSVLGLTRMSTSLASRPLPGLPVEIITRILAHAILRPKPDWPSSDHYPLRHVSHLLLVSKAFHQLAQPFWLDSITIAHPEAWVTFFGAETGIFSGEDGARRWKHVNVISLVRAVYAPLVQQYDGGRFLLVPIAIPLGRRIQHLCLLDSADGREWDDESLPDEEWGDLPGAADAFHVLSSDEERRDAALAVLRGRGLPEAEQGTKLYGLGRYLLSNPFDPPPADEIWNDKGRLMYGSDPTYAAIYAARMESLLRRAVGGVIYRKARKAIRNEGEENIEALFELTEPVAVHYWSTNVCHFLPIELQVKVAETFVIHNRDVVMGRWDVRRKRVGPHLLTVIANLMCAHAHLVGFSPDDIKEVTDEIKGSTEQHECHLKRWTWEDEDDGQTYELDMNNL